MTARSIFLLHIFVLSAVCLPQPVLADEDPGRPACAWDDHCPDNHGCNEGKCMPMGPDEHRECYNAADCTQKGFVCQMGICVPYETRKPAKLRPYGGELGEYEPKPLARFFNGTRLDFWYWGLSAGIVGGFAVGPDRQQEASSDSEFGHGVGFYIELPFDISPYFQLVPFLRGIYGQVVNTSMYEKRFGWSDMSGDFFQAGIGGRISPFLLKGFKRRIFRPYLGIYYAGTSLGTDVSETYGTGTYDCSIAYCSENTSTEILFSADHKARSLILGLGARYDFAFTNIFGRNRSDNLFSMYLELQWQQNFWYDFVVQEHDDDVKVLEDPKYAGVDMTLNHILIQFGIGVMF